MGFGEIFDMESQAVAEVILQMAPIDVENFVKRARDVESCRVTVGKLLSGTHLLPCEPFFVGEGVLHLVAVFAGRFRAEDGGDGGQLDLGYAAQRVLDLLLLRLELLLVGKMLPSTPSADPEMGAEWLCAER